MSGLPEKIRRATRTRRWSPGTERAPGGWTVSKYQPGSVRADEW